MGKGGQIVLNTLILSVHNVKINEHFFKRGQMRVDVIEQGLTKAEALAFERAILNNLRGADLGIRKILSRF